MCKKKLVSIVSLLATTLVVADFNHINKHTLEQLKRCSERAYSTFPTIINSYELAKVCLLENIEGVFIECGVASGSQVAAMNLACNETGKQRILYLFDSFEGIPLAGPEDNEQPGVGPIRHNNQVNSRELLVSSNKIYHELGGAACVSMQDVMQNLVGWGCNLVNAKFVKGWFQDTIEKESKTIDSIALLRLDGDLYESTKVCLEHLYPKVSVGGYVIIDDFGSLSGCKKAVVEYFQKMTINPDLQEIKGGGGPVYFKKRQSDTGL